MENNSQSRVKKSAIPYKKLILEAITALNDRNGSSVPAIEKYITKNHPDIALKHIRVRRVLKIMLDNEEIMVAPRHKNSYKLSLDYKKALLKKTKVQKLNKSKKEATKKKETSEKKEEGKTEEKGKEEKKQEKRS